MMVFTPGLDSLIEIQGLTSSGRSRGEDVKGGEPCHPCFSRPLCGLDCAVELVAVEGVGIPMVFCLVPRVVGWWSGRGGVEQVQCRCGRLVAVVDCACSSMAVE